MWAGRRLGMILDAEYGVVSQPETLQRFIVQICVRDFDFVQIERVRIHRESVVVRSDFHLIGDLVQHGVIRAAMPEFQFVSLPADCQAEDLVTKADPEDGNAADQFANLRGLVCKRLGIAGTVG